MTSPGLLAEIDALLTEWWAIDLNCERFLLQLDELKAQAEDGGLKSRIWAYHSLLDCHLLNLKIFDLLTPGSFYHAWCRLEELENKIANIQYNIQHVSNDYGLAFLDNAVASWQALFPYRLFFSSREIIKKKSCSICGEPRSVLRSCAHRKRKVYDGELCYDIINDWIPISFDVVSNPVNKSSVGINPDNDHHEYVMLQALLNEVKTPRQFFRARKTGRPDSRHTGVHAPHFPCPCSRNTYSYLDCCMSRPFLERTHVEICFLSPMQACLKDEDAYTYCDT